MLPPTIEETPPPGDARPYQSPLRTPPPATAANKVNKDGTAVALLLLLCRLPLDVLRPSLSPPSLLWLSFAFDPCRSLTPRVCCVCMCRDGGGWVRVCACLCI